MLTPDYLLHVSEGAEEIAAQLHTDMIKRVVSRMIAREKHGYEYMLTAADKWRLQSLMELGFLREELTKDISDATGKSEQEISNAFEDAGIVSMTYDDRIYKAAGLSPIPLWESPYLVRLMQRNLDATMGLWENFTRTTADRAEQAFIEQMDNVYNKVTSGGVGYIEAFAEGINELAKTGLFVTYPSGHKDTIETATLRCVRTGVSQATAQIQDTRMKEYGVDLVLVSSHMGARPEHQVWQGKVYSRSGNNPKYPDFVTSTGYGTGAGLCGWNCRHSFSPYFEGMDNPFDPYDDDENVRLYEKTQEQRRMERGIRKTKRELNVLDDAANQSTDMKPDLKAKADRARERLKKQQAAYYEYCDDNNLRPLPERMKIAQTERKMRKVNKAS